MRRWSWRWFGIREPAGPAGTAAGGARPKPPGSACPARYPVEIDMMSTLPNVPEHLFSGHGAGKTSLPAAKDAARHDWIASHTDALAAEAHTPTP